MSGGYIQCGDFMGSDKSGSAISGLVDALAEFTPPAERDSFAETVIVPLREALADCEDHILIEPDIAVRLIPALESFNARVGQELAVSEPSDAIEKDKEAGLNPIDAKWGKGKGWQYYCAHDLLTACRVSIETGEPICVSFD
jgi:hypothetical protein